MDEAWVAFSDAGGDNAALWWLRWLKPGFRHCFVVLGDAATWVVIDPVSPFTEVAALNRPDFPDLPDWFRRQGMTVTPAPLRRDRRRPAPWRPYTCVEAVKRVLGMHAPAVLTPWQLHRQLERNIFV